MKNKILKVSTKRKFKSFIKEALNESELAELALLSDNVVEAAYMYMNDMQEATPCYCGHSAIFLSYSRGYTTFCSRECAKNDPNKASKIKATNQKRYGSNSPMGNSSIIQKAKTTLLKNYGVEYPGQINKNKGPVSQQLIAERQEAFNDFVSYISSISEIKVNEADSTVETVDGTKYKFLRYFNGKSAFKTADKYTLQNEALKYMNSNIKYIIVDEERWIAKKHLWKAMIAARTLPIETARASKFTIREIKGAKEKNKFLNENHIQGADRSNINIGLYDENEELQSIMTVCKPRFNKAFEFELSRFATKMNLRIHGGASKLWKYFVEKYAPSSVVSYASLDYTTGNVYNHLGFNNAGETPPNYIWTDNKTLSYSRYMVSRKSIGSILNNVNMMDSISTNMRNNGFFKVFNAGSYRFEWSA